MNMLCLFIVKMFSEQRIFMIFDEFSQTKGSFARGVRDFLGINEMPLC